MLGGGCQRSYRHRKTNVIARIAFEWPFEKKWSRPFVRDSLPVRESSLALAEDLGGTHFSGRTVQRHSIDIKKGSLSEFR
jgi:hypothetical protein